MGNIPDSWTPQAALRYGTALKKNVRVYFLKEDRGYSTFCWIWQLGTGKGGYGQFRSGDVKHMAHRYVYEAVKGELPDDKVLHHKCFVRCCVNPQHLEPMTRSEHTSLHQRLLKPITS